MCHFNTKKLICVALKQKRMYCTLHIYSTLSFFTGLGGCIRGLTIRDDERNPPAKEHVNLAVASQRSLRVYLDGCPTGESRFHCRGNDSVLVYSGRKTQVTDYNLQPFTGNNVLYTFTIM